MTESFVKYRDVALADAPIAAVKPAKLAGSHLMKLLKVRSTEYQVRVTPYFTEHSFGGKLLIPAPQKQQEAKLQAPV